MKKVEKAMSKFVNRAINLETYGWPPVCMGAIYQPARPTVKPDKSIKDEQHTHKK